LPEKLSYAANKNGRIVRQEQPGAAARGADLRRPNLGAGASTLIRMFGHGVPTLRRETTMLGQMQTVARRTVANAHRSV
jgi:hypothetical protein